MSFDILNSVAQAAVEAFVGERDAGVLPEMEPGWNDALVAAIHEEKSQYRKSQDLKQLLRIAGELLYGRDIHWAMELVQNAEDAGAKRMVFVFQPDRVLVWNDGEAFVASDLWAICSAGHSPKRNKIGFFGIGFKSVYKVTDAPEIYSGPYAVRIEEKLYPSPLSPRHRPGAWFVLPLRLDQRDRVTSMLEQISSSEFAQVLLTLSSLNEIRVLDRVGSGLSGRFTRTEIHADDAGIWDDCEIADTWSSSIRVWRRFKYETEPVPAGISREGRSVAEGDRSAIILARTLDGADDRYRIHCYLPTATQSQLRWVVQGDFEPSASREQLRQSDWNAWLMEQTGRALARAIELSARELGDEPWEMIPLDKEVSDVQQRIAYEAAFDAIQTASFVGTAQGWRPPVQSTWGFWPGITEAVLESDLLRATSREVSYIRAEILGPIVADTQSRAEQVLAELGAEAVNCADLARLFTATDEVFYEESRDASWWLAALEVFARHGEEGDLAALAHSKCIPVRGGRRVRPSPPIDDRGYLVAFSRSDLTADLEAFIGESQVFLVDDFLTPKGRKGERGADDDALEAIRSMLESPPFGVAREAGPLHVVANLVVPRLSAIAAHSTINDAQADHVWRLVEYVRQKWPTYVSEYKRWRTNRATEDAIARELGKKLCVVCTVGSGASRKRIARPASEVYIGKVLLGWEAMDVALSGIPAVPFVDELHARPLRLKAVTKGGRSRTRSPGALDFLRLLGASIGPRVTKRAPTQTTPWGLSWVDWSGLPAGSQNRVALENDWESDDLKLLAERWPSLGHRSRASRGAALLRAIDEDWQRLAPTSTATAQYFYRSWINLRAAPSSWIGRLRQLDFVRAASGNLRRPADLVIDNPRNRAVVGDLADILGSKPASADAFRALGVSERPGLERTLQRLSDIRSREAEIAPKDMLVVARSCYEVLSDHVRDEKATAGSAVVRGLLRSRFRGGSGRGLIYAPPPEGADGERWWPAKRVIRSDASKWVGPYVGQLVGRYPRASPLWDLLAIDRDLTADLATDIVWKDLPFDSDQQRAAEYYGRIVAFLQQQPLDSNTAGTLPALTTVGWRPGSETVWSNRTWIRDAFTIDVPWWTPASRDPSSHRAAAKYLAIKELSLQAGSPLTARWHIDAAEPVELEAETPWIDALRTWPQVLREDADPESWPDIDDLAERVAGLTPRVSSRIRVSLRFDAGNTIVKSFIEPAVVLRETHGVVLGRSVSDLFSAAAAAEISSLSRTNQRAWGRQLALLLAQAQFDPDALSQISARHAATNYRHRGFVYGRDLPDEEELAAAANVPAPKKKVMANRLPSKSDAPHLADPRQFRLKTISRGEAGSAPVPPSGGRLKAPRTGESAEPGDRVPAAPPRPTPRYANTEIEAAARPFVEQFEQERRGCTLTRQGPYVGADYLASDGRYIEVKAFSGAAGDSFELEATEWRAAKKEGIADRYWVYIVEHLRDTEPPRVTAVFNPVLDEITSKEPTGKLRVRGWKAARTQYVGEFEGVGAVNDGDADSVPIAEDEEC